MIASVQPRSTDRGLQSVKFEELLPTITQQSRLAFRDLPAFEREELTAEVIANCFVAYRRLIERGLGDVIFATPLTQYAIKQIRSGRRVAGKLNIHDITSPYCQRRKGVVVERLYDRDSNNGSWQEVLVEDRNAGPADVAATRIDFSAWLRMLKPKLRRIAKTLATGESTGAAARKHRVSPARISQLRRELMDRWLSFQGEAAVAW